VNSVRVEFVPQADDEVEVLANYVESIEGIGAVELRSAEDGRLAAETAVVLVILGLAGLAAVTLVVDWLRDRKDCLLVIDTRGDELTIQERCDISGRRGQVVIVTGPQERVVIQHAQGALDVEEIVKRAIDQSAQSAAALAVSNGAEAFVEDHRKPLV
jgi:hypothetical protein